MISLTENKKPHGYSADIEEGKTSFLKEFQVKRKFQRN